MDLADIDRNPIDRSTGKPKGLHTFYGQLEPAQLVRAIKPSARDLGRSLLRLRCDRSFREPANLRESSADATETTPRRLWFDFAHLFSVSLGITLLAGSGFQPAIVRTCSRALGLSAMPGKRRRSSTAALRRAGRDGADCSGYVLGHEKHPDRMGMRATADKPGRRPGLPQTGQRLRFCIRWLQTRRRSSD
jgi:hypothetical protein